VNSSGLPDGNPGLMSFTLTVPASVPSLAHSSRPSRWPPAKYTRPSNGTPRRVSGPSPYREGNTPDSSALPISLSRLVPASVPSVTHNSVPRVPSCPANRSLPSGRGAPADVTPANVFALRSSTRKLPAGVPSDRYSSAPVATSSAVK
jgi:hypothetical protein